MGFVPAEIAHENPFGWIRWVLFPWVERLDGRRLSLRWVLFWDVAGRAVWNCAAPPFDGFCSVGYREL